ncbi:c-type cytochrome [Desulfomicrobium escambiense]|uniref:c-type cytochrome n=1 Tax=Desulfomicrobium escambiense TaxID=29503 RepID=UPI0004241B54|nr:c-type cytochrome [Desulfomicrobium escambiense]
MKYVFVCLAACLFFAAPALAEGPADLYAKNCKGCHGADGSKVAMGMTRPLNSLTLDEVKAALSGYKSGTYGGAKKAMMERVVKPLSDADLEALAAHVDSL